MYISTDVIIAASVVVSALVVIIGAITGFFKKYNKSYEWYKRQSDQDEDIKKLKKEMTLLCYCTQATLDGLMQLGCNHTVPTAKDKLDKYLNQAAHDQED